MYYVRIVNRVIGWVFFTSGLIGCFNGHIGQYMHFTPIESYSSLIIGFFFIYGARKRERMALLMAILLGTSLLMWCISALVIPIQAGNTEPVEFLLRMLSGIWAIYASVQDILIWRTRETTS